MSRGGVTFETAGGAREMRFTMNRMADFQEARGESLVEGVTEMEKRPADIVRLRAIFACGCDLDHASAGDLVDEIGFLPAVSVIRSALAAAFPPAAKPEKAGGGKSPGNRQQSPAD